MSLDNVRTLIVVLCACTLANSVSIIILAVTS